MKRALIAAAISILSLPADAGAAGTRRTDISAAELKELTPEGYKVEAAMACGPQQGEHLVALSDAGDLQVTTKPVIILLVGVDKKVVVEDSVTPHTAAPTAEFWKGPPPNYFGEITRENVGGGDLFLVKSVLSGGGSGSLHFFDFYRVDRKKLRLVKSFTHERMEQTYFAVYKNAIYNAEPVCTRGESMEMRTSTRATFRLRNIRSTVTQYAVWGRNT